MSAVQPDWENMSEAQALKVIADCQREAAEIFRQMPTCELLPWIDDESFGHLVEQEIERRRALRLAGCKIDPRCAGPDDVLN
ncbi:hypothetical protein M2323_002750 [Rhodoblastus acidophilus]|uniref:hypothetical protein n=1 Tax=Rhodoblastus acidophilus TaxID=1074 RepID=UPI002225157A|nr:hypothetical protein [Rhodoblastus acidophilus]MCW2284896.1 hypothetical protein [Rhodoblastus acidophilus]MCW2333814.1 hypothetical protein [Rhodoblastus acidophilus]